MAAKVADAYTVVLKQRKLPLSLMAHKVQVREANAFNLKPYSMHVLISASLATTSKRPPPAISFQDTLKLSLHPHTTSIRARQHEPSISICTTGIPLSLPSSSPPHIGTLPTITYPVSLP